MVCSEPAKSPYQDMRYEVLAGFVLAQHIVHLASFCKKRPACGLPVLPERLQALDQLVGRAFVVPRRAALTSLGLLLR